MCLASIVMPESIVPSIIHFGSAKPEVTTSSPAPDRLVAGHPQHTAHNFFGDTTDQFFAGVWESTTGKWRVRYTENEFCHIKAGVVRIDSVSGESWTFETGDSFVIPSGFEGTWDVIEPVRKLYVIFAPALP